MYKKKCEFDFQEKYSILPFPMIPVKKGLLYNIGIKIQLIVCLVFRAELIYISKIDHFSHQLSSSLVPTYFYLLNRLLGA